MEPKAGLPPKQFKQFGFYAFQQQNGPILVGSGGHHLPPSDRAAPSRAAAESRSK
jgi:hypothetical protein